MDEAAETADETAWGAGAGFAFTAAAKATRSVVEDNMGSWSEPLRGGGPGLYTVRGGGYCAPQSRDVTRHVLLHDDNQFINLNVIESVYHFSV